MKFSCSEQQSSISVHGLNGAAPVILKNDFLQCHAFVWVFGVRNSNSNVKVIICNARHWDCGKVVKKLIIVVDKIVICSSAYNCHDSTKQKLDVGNIQWRVGKQLCEKFSKQSIVRSIAFYSNCSSINVFGLKCVANHRREYLKGGTYMSM